MTKGIVDYVSTTVTDWHGLAAGEAVLSTCSGLITITDSSRRVVQLLQFSVTGLSVANRIATSTRHACQYHFLPGPAHTILAQACLGFLLHLDDDIETQKVKDLSHTLVPSCTLDSTMAKLSTSLSNTCSTYETMTAKLHYFWQCDTRRQILFFRSMEQILTCRTNSTSYTAKNPRFRLGLRLPQCRPHSHCTVITEARHKCGCIRQWLQYRIPSGNAT